MHAHEMYDHKTHIHEIYVREIRVLLRGCDDYRQGMRRITTPTSPMYYEPIKHTARVEQAKYRRRAYGTHIESVAEFSES
jgi:hypothetical protein